MGSGSLNPVAESHHASGSRSLTIALSTCSGVGVLEVQDGFVGGVGGVSDAEGERAACLVGF